MTKQRMLTDEAQINEMLENVELNNSHYWYIEIFPSYLQINVIEDDSHAYITSLEHYKYMNNLAEKQKAYEVKIEDKSIIIRNKYSEKNNYFDLAFEISKTLVKEDVTVMIDLG